MMSLALLTALVLAMTEGIKRIEVMPKKYLPVIAIVIGVGLSLVTKHLGEEASQAIIQGLIAALTACGLFSGVKNITQEIKK